MSNFARSFYGWKPILLTSGVSALMLVASIFAVWLRPFALPVGFMASLLHFVLSVWLLRDYMYGGADFDSEYSYAPSGLAKSFFMLGSFIVLLALSLIVSIISIEQGCLSSLQNELGVCDE